MEHLDEKVGQHLIVGIPGTRAAAEIISHLRAIRPAGLIFFRLNFASARNFKKLITEIEEALGYKLLIAVDHEGGRVIHLAQGVTVFPDNLAVASAQKEIYVAEQGRIEARELRRLGIDINLAPTVDVLTKNFSPNIGIRSYGRDPDLVARLGAARIRAMQKGGLSACAKHFPGQGHSNLDAHLGLPVLGGTWNEMRRVHLKPFIAAVRAGVDTIMSSHPVYPHLDPQKIPATFSRRLIHDCLRRELGFEGVILTDDLEMGALKNFGTIGESATRAVAAGHDMVLICHDLRAQKEAHRKLIEAYRKKDLSFTQLEMTLERIERLKAKRHNRFDGGPPAAEKKGEKIAAKIAYESAIRLARGGRSINRKKSALVVFPRLSGLADKIFIEDEMMNEKRFVRGLLSRCGIQSAAVEIVDFDASENEIKHLARLAVEKDFVLFFCYDAHLYEQTRKLLKTLEVHSKQCAVVLLRDPYDREFLSRKTIAASAFGFRAVQIRAALSALCRPSRKNAPG